MTSSTGDRILALIPAYRDSAQPSDLHLRRLAGRPLIAHSIDSARASATVDRVVVSTDDEQIAATAQRYGAQVAFSSIAALGQDPTELSVVQLVLRSLDEADGGRPDVVVLLRPTRPLRRHEDIDRAVELLGERPDAHSVRSVAEPLESPHEMASIGLGEWLTGLLPNGGPAVYWPTGAVDAARWATVMELDSLTGANIAPLVVDPLAATRIGDAVSFDLVQWMIHAGHVPWVSPGSRSPIGLAGTRRFRRPKVLVSDFDGVFTDNRLWMDQHGEESVVFDRGDGMGINLLRHAGIDMLVLSTEVNPIVGARCRKLGVECVQGQSDKRAALVQWAAERGTDLADIAYVGNDVNDLGCFEAAGIAIGVQDSHVDVLASVDLILSRPGGAGAVREACDLVLSFSEADDG